MTEEGKMETERQSLKKKFYQFVMFRLALMIELIRNLKQYFKVALFYQRCDVIKTLGEGQQVKPIPPKVIAVIPHITSVEESKDRQKAVAKIEKLRLTIDSLLASFAHCELTIVIKTVAEQHITAYLPEYQINCIQVQEESDLDPMFMGFKCQDELVKRVDEFDWFLFLEDDILLEDSFILEKLEKFNTNCGSKRALLFPNRYELWEGTKRYIDLIIDRGLEWNRLSTVEVDGVKFGECTNPHSGFFGLSKDQVKLWMESGREWNNKNLGFGGPRECAATYSLLECFSIYKPHTTNLHFFEVRHYDTKYSQLYPELSPDYIFSAIQPKRPVMEEEELTKTLV
jgi:hypothetical protein